MSLSEQEKKRMIALTRRLKEQKGIEVKKNELQMEIKAHKENQAKALAIKEQFKDDETVSKAADETHEKLQGIINDLNDYMGAIMPEGLLDLGTDSRGQSSIAAG